MKCVFLSHSIDEKTPTYGNRNSFKIYKRTSIKGGDVSNNSNIETTLHIGTHIDLPYHYYEEGQTIKCFDASFWLFKKPLIIEIIPKEKLIENELIQQLGKIVCKKGVDIIIVKTGCGINRDGEEYWQNNFGFSQNVYDFIKENFNDVRAFGFDSISISCYQQRDEGREAHLKFLNPKSPVLLIEDMNLNFVGSNTIFKELIIAPMLIENAEALPVTILGLIADD